MTENLNDLGQRINDGPGGYIIANRLAPILHDFQLLIEESEEHISKDVAKEVVERVIQALCKKVEYHEMNK